MPCCVMLCCEECRAGHFPQHNSIIYEYSRVSGAWKEKLESYRAWFLEQDAMKAEETKRPGKKIDTGEIFGFEGSFRQLQVD